MTKREKTIAECDHFGTDAPLTEKELRACGCTRCQQEIDQRQWLHIQPASHYAP